MSEEPLSPDSAPAKPAAKKAARRVSTPRPRKTAKDAGKEKPVTGTTPEAPAPVAPVSTAPVPAKLPIEPVFPPDPPSARESAAPSLADERQDHERKERQEREESRAEDPRRSDDGGQRNNWPEPETIQGGEGGGSGSKRKRRRKKKGGQGGQSVQGQVHSSESHAPRPPQGVQQPAPAPAEAGQPPRVSPPAPQAPRVPIDADDLTKKAWKIFLGEVGEEGLALIGDQDARELSRRSFRLAEIFLEEQGRRIR